jgi:hypothetical protein
MAGTIPQSVSAMCTAHSGPRGLAYGLTPAFAPSECGGQAEARPPGARERGLASGLTPAFECEVQRLV